MMKTGNEVKLFELVRQNLKLKCVKIGRKLEDVTMVENANLLMEEMK